jgi:4-amino-4-deoxy-L-arabinose transferase-like glycosyltransferase
MVGASAVTAAAVGVVAAAAGRSTVGDDLTVAVVAMWRSAGVGATTVGLGWEVSSSTVRAVVGAATCGFVVAGFGWSWLVDSIVDPHEVGVFSKLGDDLSSTYA